MLRYGSIILLLVLLGCSGGRQSLPPEGTQIDSEIERFRNKVEDEPGDFRAQHDLAKLLVQENRLPEALTHVDKALAIEPQHLESRLLKGQIQFDLGRAAAAYQEFLVLMNDDSSMKWVEAVGASTGMRYPVRQLTRGNFDNAHPAYAPDGDRIAFQSNRYQNWDLFVMETATQKTTQLTSNPLHDEAPVFVESDRLLFTRQQSARGNKRDIYVVQMSEKKEDAIIVHPSDDWYPAPYQAGGTMFFVSDRDIAGNTMSKILQYDFTSNQILPFLPRELEYGAPDINRAGTAVLFSARNADHYALFFADLSGETVKRLTYLDMDFGAPRFSPDGTRVAFFSKVNDNYDIYELDIRAERVKRLTAGPHADLAPVYSPDGERIAYYSNQTGSYQIYEIDLVHPFSREQLISQMRTVVAGGDID